MRSILSGYLGVSPKSVRFQSGPHGKPTLAGDFAGAASHFNLSYAHGLTLCACVRDRVIGIDLEQFRPLNDLESIAQRFFSGAEYAQRRALPPDQKLEVFYNCWTRKEAYIKACGDGLAHPLDQFEVSMDPDEPARMRSIGGNSLIAARWFLQALDPASDYIAALAIEGQGWNIKYRRWADGL